MICPHFKMVLLSVKNWLEMGNGVSRDMSQATQITQMRDDDSLNSSDNQRSGKKQSEFGYILKVEKTRFLREQDIKEEQHNDEFKDFT